MVSCPGCRKEIREGWRFCRFCGHALTAQDSEPETSLREHIPTAFLARRIGPGEMGGILNKTVVVDEGQSALLFVGGRHDLTLGPGKHSMGNILSSRTRDATVVIVRTSDVSLDASVSRLLSSDPLSLSLGLSSRAKNRGANALFGATWPTALTPTTSATWPLPCTGWWRKVARRL